jgi:hypothetical protein
MAGTDYWSQATPRATPSFRQHVPYSHQEPNRIDFPNPNVVPWQNVGEYNGPIKKMAHPQASPPIICLQCAGYGHLKSVCPSRKAYTRTATGDLIQGPNTQQIQIRLKPMGRTSSIRDVPSKENDASRLLMRKVGQMSST